MFHMYSNPEATGWLGWFEDGDSKCTAFVRLNRKVVFTNELDWTTPFENVVKETQHD